MPSRHLETVPLHLDDARMRPGLRDRSGAARCQRLKFAIGAAAKSLNNLMRQDAFRRADQLDEIAERGELVRQWRSRQRLEPQFTRAWNGRRRAC
jgi:hypothetical protein